MSVEEFDRRVAALLGRPLFSGNYLNLTFMPGWVGLIEHLVVEIEALPGRATLRCSQLKEKWGTLRMHIYLDSGDTADDLFEQVHGLRVRPRPEGVLGEQVEQLILTAEGASASLCVICGHQATAEPGQIYTICSHHAATGGIGLFDNFKTYFRR